MALGLARDSYHKLSSLSSAEHDSSDSELSYSIATAPRVGDSTIVSLGLRGDNVPGGKYNDEGSHSSGSKSSSSPTKESSYGAYSGFAMDYAEYDSYRDPYAPTLLGNDGGTNKNVFCCLFAPWLAGSDRMIQPDDVADVLPPPVDGSDNEGVEASAIDTQGAEISSEAVVDHPTKSLTRSASENEDENSTGSDVLGDKLTDKERSAVLARLRLSQPESPLMSDPPVPTGKGLLNDIPPPEPALKGILKHSSMSKTTSTDEVRDATLGGSKLANGQRRSLFPVYHGKEEKKADDRNIRFAPMARVVTVKSRKNMNIAEKAAVWWQKADYEDFKKTGRLVAKAMLQGGSEVWLMTNKSWQAPGTKKAILGQTSGDDEPSSTVKDLDNKWWHKFGHSRRGLEHIASVEEGKQRQMNVRVAVRAVLDEQRKQRMYGRNDQEKIRTTYLQYCSWARELAVAAGASDESAVSSNFSETRHSREFYLLKHRNGGTGSAHVPDFMKPTGDGSLPNLDAHTPSQIRMRRKIAQQTEAIHDPVPHPGQSIAKKAAGFGTAEENVSMAAVLSGMGTVGANPTRTSVGAH